MSKFLLTTANYAKTYCLINWRIILVFSHFTTKLQSTKSTILRAPLSLIYCLFSLSILIIVTFFETLFWVSWVPVLRVNWILFNSSGTYINLQSIINLQFYGLYARCISISAPVKELGLVSRVRVIATEKCMHFEKCIHATYPAEISQPFIKAKPWSHLTTIFPQPFELRSYYLFLYMYFIKNIFFISKTTREYPEMREKFW